MPGLLSRSKSMRLLKGHRKELQYEQAQNSMPRVGASQTDNDGHQLAAPISRAEAKLETPDLALRPSTSGGTGERRTLFHMKTTPAPSVHSQNDLTFCLTSNSTTTFRTTDITDSREGIIGIALGSPTGSHWTSTPQAADSNVDLKSVHGNMVSYTQPSRFPSPVPGRQELPKSKLGRWKSLFRKAPPPPPQPDKPAFYQLTTTITATRAARADSHHDDELVEPQVKSTTDRHTGRTPSPPTFKPNIRASRTFTTPEAPRARTRAFTAGTLPANPRASVQRSATTPVPSSHTGGDFPALPQSLVSKSTQAVPTLPGQTSLLDVSIPDITLDRYSVMFNNLLKTSNSNRTSTLLERRQGNAEKLKPLTELSAKDNVQESPMDYNLKRRATSPVTSASPRLSLFPNTNPGRAASPPVPRTKALHRSKTAPEKSPLRQTYSRAEMNSDNTAQELFVQKVATSPKLKPRASMNLQVQQLAITPTSVHSFESETDSITLVVGRTTPGQPQTVHLDDREPDWELCAKPKPPPIARANTSMPTSGLARTDSQRQPKVTKFSALSSHAPTSAPLEAPSPLQRIQQLQSPPLSAREKRTASENKAEGTPKAMVGVARSVSVSRANSPRAIVRTTNELRSPGERLGEGKCLTPTMVEVRNRKSQRVQLVDA